MRLNHYTSIEGLAKIQKSGVILPSEASAAGGGDDAAYGSGVYLTRLDKQLDGATAVAQNNWGTTQSEKMGAVIEVELPVDKVVNVGEKDGRDVFLHSEPIELTRDNHVSWKYTPLRQSLQHGV